MTGRDGFGDELVFLIGESASSSISMSFLKFSVLVDSRFQMGIGYKKLDLNTEYKNDGIIFPVIFSCGRLPCSS